MAFSGGGRLQNKRLLQALPPAHEESDPSGPAVYLPAQFFLFIYKGKRMKRNLLILLSIALLTGVSFQLNASVNATGNSEAQTGYRLVTAGYDRTVINYSIENYSINDVLVNGEVMKAIALPGVLMPGTEGAPDLPSEGRYIAIPKGASVSARILSSNTSVLEGLNIAPAPAIPTGKDDGPLHYMPDPEIYARDAFYPASPVMVSEVTSIRGLDVVVVEIFPFRYNPVTGQLEVNQQIEIEVTHAGGQGVIGEERLRSRWWDPLMYSEVLNSSIIPAVDFNQQAASTRTTQTGYEYLIITPDMPEFLAWADSIRQFRIRQGIKTGIVTTTEAGGNTVAALKTYIDNAYNTWDIPPVAVLLLGDFSTGSGGIISHMYAHPSGYPNFASDNYYADVNGDNLPDLVIARITANDATQLQVMVSKFLNYERNPPVSSSFYNNPVTALGWQTERWFQLCSEIVAGYFSNVQGKSPVRINAVYSGNPAVDPWSTAYNTAAVLNYFGPSGLGYIPATPQETGGFSGGTTSDIVSAINSGTFMVLHRDHGSYSSWGEPLFTTNSVNSLNNVNNQLPYIFSINCQTGAYPRATETLAEKFHRHTSNGQNSGALGVLAASEVSYSFANDAYLWGVFDNLFPDFMPAQSTTFPSAFALPAFAASAGKHFLYQSSWTTSSTAKITTYRLFHHHGDAFMNLYTEVPQTLAVSHPLTLDAGQTSMQVTANSGAFIAITAGDQILATATASGSPLTITFPPLESGVTVYVTITKQNFKRYSKAVEVASNGLVANFSWSDGDICSGEQVAYTDLSLGGPVSWSWQFPGGTPSASTQRNPVVTYNTGGTYNVSLTVTNAQGSNTLTRQQIIHVNGTPPAADFTQTATQIVAGGQVTFTDASSGAPDSWAWTFQGGNPATATGSSKTVTYSTPGTYTVTLTASNCAGSSTKTKTGLIQVLAPPPVPDFTADPVFVLMGESVAFSGTASGDVTAWSWSFPGGMPSVSSLQNPQITYATPGIYNVTLTVSGPSGSNTVTKTNYIEVWDGQITYCATGALNWTSEWISGVKIGDANNTTGAAGYSDFTGFTFTVTAGQSNYVELTPGFKNRAKREFWKVWIDFNGDGNFYTQGEEVFSVNGSTGVASGSFTIPADYSGTFRMRVAMRYNAAPPSCGSYDYGETEDYTITILPANTQPPVVAFTADPQSLIAGGTVQFTDLSLNAPTAWSWSFPGGNPSASNQQNPSVFYATPGVYNVTLTATNGFGSNTLTKQGYIIVSAEQLNADFTASSTAVLVGQPVQFTDLSTGNPSAWYWDFGDEASYEYSTDAGPEIYYTLPGVYTVMLTVSRDGASDTEVKTSYITVSEPQAVTYCNSMSLDPMQDWIAGVTIGAFTNNSGATPYSDFTNMIVSLQAGQSCLITLTPGFASAAQKEFWKVWIDYNGNGSFEDNGELVLQANNQRKTVTGQFTVPAGVSGQTRMRVTMKRGNVAGSCEIYSQGETEDYTVDFSSNSFKEGSIVESARVYPNPTTGHAYIETGHETADLEVWSLDGKLVGKERIAKHGTLDLSGLKSGIYLLRVISDANVETLRIVKTH